MEGKEKLTGKEIILGGALALVLALLLRAFFASMPAHWLDVFWATAYIVGGGYILLAIASLWR